MTQELKIRFDDFQGRKFRDLAVLFPEEFQLLHDYATLKSVKAGEVLIQEGQAGEALYLVKYGRLRVIKRHDGSVYEIATISTGDVLGEVAVLFQTVASAEVLAMDDCELYEIPMPIIQDVLESNDRFLRSLTQLAEKRSAAGAIAVNPVFSTLPMAAREVALFNARFVKIDAGEELVVQGEHDLNFVFLILSGDLDVACILPSNAQKRVVVETIVSGDEACDIPLVTNAPHTMTIVATDTVRVLAIKNEMVVAWVYRYSDFAYALYGEVYRKLRAYFTTLEAEVGEAEAKALTLDSMPSLEEFKQQHGL
jgi:CRP-like cAMP-binding protein